MLVRVIEPIFTLTSTQHKRGMCSKRDHKRHFLQQLAVSTVYAIENTDSNCRGFGDRVNRAMYIVEVKHLAQTDCRIELHCYTEGHLVAVAEGFSGTVDESPRRGQVVI